jgi:replicative DNA helicase
MFTELLQEDIEKGIKGENKGMPTGFSNIDEHTNGIQKSLYVLVGGNSG